MNPEKRHLIDDLLREGESRRAATLLAGRRILQRRRARRVALRSFALVAILALAAFSLQRMLRPAPQVFSPHPSPKVPLHGLTDEELLALFPDTPVGLATLADGKKRLIFPRPGDESRYLSQF